MPHFLMHSSIDFQILAFSILGKRKNERKKSYKAFHEIKTKTEMLEMPHYISPDKTAGEEFFHFCIMSVK